MELEQVVIEMEHSGEKIHAFRLEDGGLMIHDYRNQGADKCPYCDTEK